MKKGVIIGTIIAVVLVCFGLAMYRVSSKGSSKIEVMAIEESQKDKVFMNGQIEAKSSKSFYKDPTKGTVDSVKVKDGDSVKSGATLYTYKNEEVINQIDDLKSQIKTAKKSKSSTSSSKDLAAVSVKAQADAQVDAQVDGLENQIKSLDKKKYYTVKAPFSGKVTVNKNTDDQANPLVTVYSTDFYVKVTVSERDYGKIKIDDKVEINIVPTNKKLTGTIKSISDNPVTNEVMPGAAMASAGEGSNMSTYNVDVYFDGGIEENIKNGFHVQATKKTIDNTIKVPEAAVLTENKESYCFKVVDKKLVKQPVKLGEIKGKSIVVKEGIKLGDSIVKNPDNKMKEGDSVE